MSLLRQTLVFAAFAITASSAFSQSATDFRSAATKAFPATVAVLHDKVKPNEPLKSILHPGDRSLMLLRGNLMFSFDEPSVAGFAIAPDLAIVAMTGSTGDVVQLRAQGHKSLEGKIIANDYVLGLAVVRLDSPSLSPLDVGVSPLEPGQPILMTELSMAGDLIASSGMIASFATASNQELGMVHRLNVANNTIASGAPLVNEKGVLVGVAILTQTGAVCLPASSINRLFRIAQSESPTDLRPGRLGVALSGMGETTVTEVLSGSPADKAGLRPGDQIVSVGGQPTSTAADVIAVVAMHRGGDTIEVVATRDGKEATYSVVLDSDMSKQANVPDIMPPHMWRMEQGKLVPMDEKLGGNSYIGPKQWIPKMPQAPNMPELGFADPIVVRPPELRGITIERGKLDESMGEIRQQLEQTLKNQRVIEERLRNLSTPQEANDNQERSAKPDIDKLQRLLESLQEEIQTLKANRS